MKPLPIIGDALADGVTLSLSVTGSIKAIGDQDHVARWLPLIRQQKAEIIAALQEAANDDTGVDNASCFGWLIHFTDRPPLYVTFSPEVNHDAALAGYPDAVAAKPMPDGVCIDLGRSEVRAEPPGDRITCAQCLNLRNGVCAVARPGGPVSAQIGYRPAPDLLQRCEAFNERNSHANH